MSLNRATIYLKNVIAQKEIIPFRRFMGGIGRHAQVRLLKIIRDFANFKRMNTLMLNNMIYSLRRPDFILQEMFCPS
jgi:ribosomal protein L22